ncbi:MAG: transposase [Candidatus Thiodiazotropha sp. (ex Lucinoma borealis)]|nr:transposase [Candidatus Thiodiazotropha sp. (ex Lucinoma borealis)]
MRRFDILHAGAVAQAHQRNKLERLCVYIVRPAVSENSCCFWMMGGCAIN